MLAAALCHDAEVRTWFPDGLLWVTLGASPVLVGAQRALVAHLGEEPTFSDVIQGRRALGRLLEPRRCLVVLDDVWSLAAAEALAVTSPRGRVLYTTRDASLLASVGAVAQPVDVLDLDASLGFLEAELGSVADADRAVCSGPSPRPAG